MESFARFLLDAPKYKDRVFVSNSPGATVLIWTNRTFLPNVSGIAVVEAVGHKVESGLSSSEIVKMLRKQLCNTISVLEVKYDSNMEFMEIDGVKLNLTEAAQKICNAFSITLGATAAKKANDASQINDPFHTWSRDAFDGANVIKADLDIVIAKDGVISALVEIKRSNKVRVGRWSPYIDPNRNNDGPNYLMMLSLANILKCKAITIHHDEMDHNVVFTGDEKIDVFVYEPQPNQSTLEEYVKHRKTLTIKELLKV